MGVYASLCREKKMTDRTIGYVIRILTVLPLMALFFIFAGCGSYAADPGVPQADTKVYTQTQGEEYKKDKKKPVTENSPDDKIKKEEVNSKKKEAGEKAEKALRFRNERLLREHYEKHGIDMGFKSAGEYEEAASAAALNPKALHKKEKEDGDDVYYVKATNEFVIVSKDGYIRTYFLPDSGIRYYNKQ